MEQTLVRAVSRAFCGPEPTIVLDAIINHTALNLEQLRTIFTSTGRVPRDLQKSVGTLRDAGLVSMISRQETKANAQKATTIEYFYVDYRLAIDATKYRLHFLESALHAKGRPTTARTDFHCPRCKSAYTQLEVMDDIDPQGRGSGFVCKKCGTVLVYTPQVDKVADALNDASSPIGVFNTQFGWLVEMLKKIDAMPVPVTNGEMALEGMVPPPKDESALPGLLDVNSGQSTVKPSAVLGQQAKAEKVEVHLTTDRETSAAEVAAEAARKAKIAAQNALPEWHTNSTVVNGSSTPKNEVKGAETPTEKKEAEGKTPEGGAVEDDLADFFTQMQAQKDAKQAQADEEDDEEDDDEDDFEDVDVIAPPEAKRPRTDDGSAKASDSNANTPAGMSTPAMANGSGTPVVAEESDEDEEFETVV
ncbi:hypothetical protein BT63DRAFT_420680 [Microthyrium microscopicum]|uniref:Transcription initiation factor IIE subunit alpha N-terminal domain-containing protein n=1 Tax=Microthyrium microscopicum TaxID=703497 RepID=A0A6A6UWX9_9PEZI|nr:hypothetical protein BT63DRAFT_420680 [Microthyrium microscopicum]